MGMRAQRVPGNPPSPSMGPPWALLAPPSRALSSQGPPLARQFYLVSVQGPSTAALIETLPNRRPQDPGSSQVVLRFGPRLQKAAPGGGGACARGPVHWGTARLGEGPYPSRGGIPDPRLPPAGRLRGQASPAPRSPSWDPGRLGCWPQCRAGQLPGEDIPCTRGQQERRHESCPLPRTGDALGATPRAAGPAQPLASKPMGLNSAPGKAPPWGQSQAPGAGAGQRPRAPVTLVSLSSSIKWEWIRNPPLKGTQATMVASGYLTT